MLPQREEIANLVVCEDDDFTLHLLCEHLAADRFGVMPAPSASDALRLCRFNHPDLLLLDLNLPDASGL
ncbi:MAG TPA: response regulator, partial [Solirubrobacterales bacterium]|nr:response regulator [Solirubrobacterales bacterium]